MGGRVIEVKSKEDWAQHVKNAMDTETAVIVYFTATWCSSCRVMTPLFEDFSEQYPNLVFLKVDVDHAQGVATECGISSMPAFQAWKDGARVEELVGVVNERLEAMLKKYVKE